MSASANIVDIYLKRNAVATQVLNWTTDQRYWGQIRSMKLQSETLDDLSNPAKIVLFQQARELYPDNLAEELHIALQNKINLRDLEEQKAEGKYEAMGHWLAYLMDRVAEETIQRSLEG